MSQTPGVTLVWRWFGEGMTAGNVNAAHGMAAEIFADDFIDHDGLGEVITGRARWLHEVVDAIFAAFSDVEVRIEHAFGAEDLVSVRYIFSGTHTGTFAGVPSTGRRIRHSENEIYRIAGGRVAESWGEGDWLGTLRQLGAIPPAAPRGHSPDRPLTPTPDEEHHDDRNYQTPSGRRHHDDGSRP